MSRALWISSLLLLLLATLALGACGGGSGSGDVDKKNAYVRELNAAQSDFRSSAEEVSKQRVPGENAGKVRVVQQLAAAIDKLVATMRGIAVPGAVRAEHQQLIHTMTGFRADVQTLTQTFRAGDARKLRAGLAAFKAAQLQADTRVDATIAAINSKLAAS
jgi:hypothetical protein